MAEGRRSNTRLRVSVGPGQPAGAQVEPSGSLLVVRRDIQHCDDQLSAFRQIEGFVEVDRFSLVMGLETDDWHVGILPGEPPVLIGNRPTASELTTTAGRVF